MTKKRFNILEHELVPEHIVLSKEEAKKVLEHYSIQPEQLPKILASDPVVRTINAKVGDIVKIIRKSRTAKKAVAYRVVVEESTASLKSKE